MAALSGRVLTQYSSGTGRGSGVRLGRYFPDLVKLGYPIGVPSFAFLSGELDVHSSGRRVVPDAVELDDPGPRAGRGIDNKQAEAGFVADPPILDASADRPARDHREP